MRTGEGVLNQHLCALSLCNASFKLAKLRFCEARPGPAFPDSRRHKCADLSKCEPGVLARAGSTPRARRPTCCSAFVPRPARPVEAVQPARNGEAPNLPAPCAEPAHQSL